jgi:nucleotide-binding universal stress UspA family protein
MTHSAMHMAPLSSTRMPSLEGPVLLAAKPFSGFDASLAVARWLAAREERELHVVSVLEHNDAVVIAAGIPPMPERYYDEDRDALATQIRRELTALGDDTEAVHVDVVEGPSAHMVVDMARQCDARVIVIGTGKHDPIGRYLYGERALQIVSIADRPVLVVPRDATAAAVAVAVVAVDFSPASLRAARAVLPMLSRGGRLILVHVKTGDTPSAENAGWWNDPYERHSADLFAQFQRQLYTMPGVAVEVKFLRGSSAVDTLLGYATACGAELIACGRLGHSFMARVFVGSVSSGLVRQAMCPVLIAPELPGDSPAPDASHA